MSHGFTKGVAPVLVILVLSLVVTGCYTADPQFSPDVQKSFRDHDMRRMNTSRLKVYYPDHRRDEAHQVATVLERCLDDIEGSVPRPVQWWGEVPVYLPELEFNNAYVAFAPGMEPHIVVPTFFTANIFGDFGFTPSASAVGCHEMIHYVHLTQVHGTFGWINRVFGPSINPQIGLDLWFFEGLATYYESQLVEGVGRYGSPVWEAFFAAGVAETSIDGGRMSAFDRTIPYGPHYLVGSHFVAYLADTYGEERLWQVVDRQGSSFFFPFGVSLRFRQVYGRPLGGLIRDFADYVEETYPPRERPLWQEEERWLGRSAKIEPGPRGLWAIFHRDVDQVATLEVVDGQGERILRRQLPDVLPGRRLVGAWAIEALRFSPDGEDLYFLAFQPGSASGRTTLMKLNIESNRLRTVYDELNAVAGDITPDGSHYVLAAAEGAAVRISRLGLYDETEEELFTLPRGAYLGWLRISPSGQRMAVTLMEDEEWSVAVLDANTGQLFGKWTTRRSHQPVFDATFVDEDTLLFVGAVDGVPQAISGDLRTGEASQRSEVAYMAFNPRTDSDGSIRLLNRRGWGWSLDRISEPPAVLTDAVRWIPAAPDGEMETQWQTATIDGYGPLEEPTPIRRDSSYDWYDSLFWPRLRAPSLSLSTNQVQASLDLSGRDALSFHNWTLGAGYDSAENRFSGRFGYTNTQLAPWYITFLASDQWLRLTETEPETLLQTTIGEQRDRVLSLQASRTFYDIPVILRARAVEFFRSDFDEGLSTDTRRLVGPEFATQYLAGRTTPYAGARWLFGLSGQVAYYPEELTSDFPLGDARSQLEIHTPLPLSRRHRLRLSGRVRALTGVPDGEDLLLVGGFGPRAGLFSSSPLEIPDVNLDLTPPTFVFVEALRGYEDFGLATNRVAVGDLTYRYPLIIDRGFASMFMILPSFFVHGLNLEAFASAATLMDGAYHAAAGASADLEFSIWVLPFSLRYQVAQRLVDDKALVHTVSLGIGGPPPGWSAR